ncbi:hypothetical protein WA158_005289 [Blastocystis sp. Blastoise]
MSSVLTPEQTNLAKTYFDMFDTNNSGTIPDNEAKLIVRAIGLAPTDNCFKDVLKQCRKGDENVTFDILIQIILSIKQESVNPFTELMDCFRHFDISNTGYIKKEELRNILSQLGEPLTPIQITDVLESCKCNTDTIKYEDLAKKLLELNN